MNALQHLQAQWDEEAMARACVARARTLIARTPRLSLVGHLSLLIIAALPFIQGVSMGLQR